MKDAKEILTSSAKFHINLGLERTYDALNKLSNPQNEMEFIHVAGTNGKGSVCAMLNEILCTHFSGTDIKVGLFTSPHLFSYCERIKINDKDISKADLDSYINRASAQNRELTEFEILTVAALLYFREQNVKYVILEVGLGGRFDSTNVIEKPLCSIITTIDFDHTARLGNTIDEIAYQKAGIIKKNCPAVFAQNNAGYATLKKCADETQAKVFAVKNPVIRGQYELALLGDYQFENLALVLKCLQTLPFAIAEDTIKTALKSVRWKFRLEYDKEKNLLIDGAHNPSGIKSLREFLDKNFKHEKITFIFGCLNNKDYENMLKTLVRKEDEFYFYEFDYPNALKYENLPKSVKSYAKICKNPYEIIENRNGLCVVCGSLYMLGSLFNPCRAEAAFLSLG